MLVQPYLDAVDGEEAETALVFLDGELSHAMRKGPLLALDLPPVERAVRAETMSRSSPARADVVGARRRACTRSSRERFGAPRCTPASTCCATPRGAPAVLELELVEPSLFLDYAPGTAQALARAIVARLEASAR